MSVRPIPRPAQRRPGEGGIVASRCPSPRGASSSARAVPGESRSSGPDRRSVCPDSNRREAKAGTSRASRTAHCWRLAVILKDARSSSCSSWPSSSCIRKTRQVPRPFCVRLDLDAQDDLLARAEAVDRWEDEQLLGSGCTGPACDRRSRSWSRSARGSWRGMARTRRLRGLLRPDVLDPDRERGRLVDVDDAALLDDLELEVGQARRRRYGRSVLSDRPPSARASTVTW